MFSGAPVILRMQDGSLFPKGALGQERRNSHVGIREEVGELFRRERPYGELAPRNKLRVSSQLHHNLGRDICVAHGHGRRVAKVDDVGIAIV